LGKFRDNDANWRENFQRLEEHILKGAVCYKVQGGETERGLLRVGKYRDLVYGTGTCKGILVVVVVVVVVEVVLVVVVIVV